MIEYGVGLTVYRLSTAQVIAIVLTKVKLSSQDKIELGKKLTTNK
jgi:hypothetical protein